MKNLATKNQNDFTVLENGEAYISQRKAAELCGVGQSTLNEYFRSNNIDVKQGISAENLNFSITHYAQKGRERAIGTLVKFAKAGAKAYIYHQAGYEVQAVKVEKDTDPYTLTIGEAKQLEHSINNHEARLRRLEEQPRVIKQTKPLDIKAGFFIAARAKDVFGKHMTTKLMNKIIDESEFPIEMYQYKKNRYAYNLIHFSHAMNTFIRKCHPLRKGAKTWYYQWDMDFKFRWSLESETE